MLFTDSDCVSLYELLAIDSEAQNVADAISKGKDRQAILLVGPSSVAERAWSECRSKLEAALASFSTFYGPSGTQSHLAQLVNSNWYGTGTRARARLTQIVVHDTYYSNSISPIQQWVVYAALRLLYQAASLHYSGSGGKDKTSDRYEAKQDQYRKREAAMWQQILSQGMPIVNRYLSCPGAKHDYQAGVWDETGLILSPDANNTNANDQPIRIAITYYDANYYLSPTHNNNAESGPSSVISTVIPASQLLTIDISSLNPQDSNNPPQLGISQGIVPMLTATHWNCYIGLDSPQQPLWLQNMIGIPVSQKQYAVPATLLRNSFAMGPGQHPSEESNLLFGNLVTRG